MLLTNVSSEFLPVQASSPLYSVHSMATDIRQDTPHTLGWMRSLLITDRHLYTYCVKNTKGCKLVLEGTHCDIILTEHRRNVIMLCWSALCKLGFQYVNDSSGGDTVCWTGIAL